MWRLSENAAVRAVERCLLAYWVLYVFPFPIGAIPGTEPASDLYDKLWALIIPWVGAHLLHLTAQIVILPNGSGDTTFNYAQVLCTFVLAAAVAIAWTATKPRSAVSPRTREAVRIYVRYFLGVTLVQYGALKFFHLQFPAPAPGRLIEPFGESSPMGLLWTFMGASTSYLIFAGVMELGNGLLLFWRRTTLLGSVAAAGVLANIVMLNFSYDVPVKLFSLHLLAMAAFLIAPDARRLGDFFLMRQPTSPRTFQLVLPRPWMVRARPVLKGLLLVAIAFGTGQSAFAQWREAQTPSALAAAYQVVGWSGPATDRWERVGIGARSSYVLALSPQGRMYRYAVEHDAGKHSLVLREYLNPVELKAGKVVAELTYVQPDATHMVLQGFFRGAPAEIRLIRIDDASFLLTSRGFHWISEYPFNR
jgi:hypothetical protein